MKSQIVRMLQVLILSSGLFCAVPVQAQEEKSSIAALLIDLDGWKAEAAENHRVELDGLTMIMATRAYKQGGLRLEVTLMAGNSVLIHGKVAETTGEGTSPAGSGAARERVATIDGFQAYAAHDPENKLSEIVIVLAQTAQDGALFTFFSEGVTEKEALELAQKFAWKQMQTVMEKLLAPKKG